MHNLPEMSITISFPLQLTDRFNNVDVKSQEELDKLRDLLRRVKKMEVDMAQVENWLDSAEPVAVAYSKGDQTDGGMNDVEVSLARVNPREERIWGRGGGGG